MRTNTSGIKVGDKFGQVHVIGEPFFTSMNQHKKKWYAVVQHESGEASISRANHLKSPQFQGIKHRQAGSKLYTIWNQMRQRCEKSHNPRYEDYGGRGITVCEEWKEYLPFQKWAMANGYQEGLSIERMDNNGNYCAGNCKWIALSDQSENKRSVTILSHNGKSQSVHKWARESPVSASTIKRRIRHGWTVADAIEKPSCTK